MNDDDLDRTARAVLDPAPMTVAERDAAWRDLAARLEPPNRRRWQWLAIPVAAAAASVAIALVPGDSEVSLSTASAATVLRAAADGAFLGRPGPGEELFVRERRTIPSGGGREDVDVTRTWVASDGSGRQELNGRARPFSDDFAEDWRGTLSTDQMQALPEDSAVLLETLRAAVGRAAAGDRALRVYGRDLGVVATVVHLSTDAPVTAAQRAALLELLATAPDWTVPGTSVTPLSTRNLGPDRTADGESAVRLRFELRFTPEEARELSIDPEPFALDLLIDPDAGRLMELREYEDGLAGRPIVTTIEVQRIQPEG